MVTQSYKGWYYWSAAKLVVGAPTAEATNGGVRVAEAIIIVKYSATVILRRLLLRKKLQ